MDIFLSPQFIELLTVAIPACTYVAGHTASIGASETYKIIKSIFQKKNTGNQLKKCFIQSINAALNDATLELDEQTRSELFTTEHTFQNFTKFIDKYQKLSDLPFTERKETAKKILREYIRDHNHSLSDETVDKIVKIFSMSAFEVIDEYVKNNQKEFSSEVIAAFKRMEEKLDKLDKHSQDFEKNLKSLKETALFFEKLLPDIDELRLFIYKIESKINKIDNKIDKIDNKIDLSHEKIDFIKNDTETLLKIFDIITIQNEKITRDLEKIQSPYSKSSEYQDLIEAQQKIEKLFAKTPENDFETRIKLYQLIKKKKEEIESFKQDILRLSKIFSSVPINTERLRLARQYFNEGHYSQTDDILKGIDLTNDQEILLKEKYEREKGLESLKEKLHSNAEEFLIKAQITALNFSNSNRFEEAKKYYEKSLKSSVFFDNLFYFADFLNTQGQTNESEIICLRIFNEIRNDLQLDQIIAVLNLLASIQQEKKEYDLAEYGFKQVLKICRDLAGINRTMSDPVLAAALNKLALVHLEMKEYDLAVKEIKEALTILKKLQRSNSSASLSNYAAALNTLALVHLEMKDYDLAENEVKDALKIYRDLVKEDPVKFDPPLAKTLNNLAFSHKNKKEFDLAEKEYKESLAICKRLVKTCPSEFLSEVAGISNNLASMHRDKGQYDLAVVEFEESLKIYKTLAKINPSVFQFNVAVVLNNLSMLHYTMEKYDLAESEYTEALRIYKNFAEISPSIFLTDVARVLNNLAALHQDMKKYILAENEYRECLNIYRQLAKTKPSEFQSEVAYTLNNMATLYYYMENYDLMENHAKEALKIYKALSKSNSSVFLSDVAEMLVNLASIHQFRKKYHLAENEFKESLKIFKKLAIINSAQYQYDVAYTLTRMSIFYDCYYKNKKHALMCANEAVKLWSPLIEKNKDFQQYYLDCLSILKKYE